MQVLGDLSLDGPPVTIETVISRSGDPVPILNGISLHSRYDPKKEADRDAAAWLKEKPAPRAVFVFGLGFGYHIHALRARLEPNVPIVVFEPRPQMVRAYANAIGRNISGVTICASAKSQDIMDAVGQNVLASDLNDLVFAAHAPSLSTHREQFQLILDQVQAACRMLAMSLTTGWGFGFDWIEYGVTNMMRLPDLPVLNQTWNWFAARPACAVIGAGPSLDRCWDALASAQTVRLAADTALEPMAARGLPPHLAFLFDGQYENAKKLERVPTRELNLLTALDVHPSVFEREYRNLVVCGVGHGMLSWLERTNGFSAGELKQGGSVVTCAFNFASQARARHIYFAGVDLSYSEHQIYCRNTAVERRYLEAQSRFQPLEQLIHAARDERVERTVDGRQTQENLYNYARWLEDEIGRAPCGVSLLTGNSLLARSVPADGLARIGAERWPAEFDPLCLEKKLPPNGLITHARMKASRQRVLTGIESFLRLDNFRDTASLQTALESSDIRELIDVVVSPALAVMKYARQSDSNAQTLPKQLRENLGGLYAKLV